MTYIEFFDRNSIENIFSSLAANPERVILVGSNRKILAKYAAIYKEILSEKGKNIEFLCRSVNRNSLHSTIEVFSEIVNTYDNCVFDLSGGDEIFLAASGMIRERYDDKGVRLHRFNIKSNSVTECDCNGVKVHRKAVPSFSVEDNIRVYGGRVMDAQLGFFGENFTDGFKKDICDMWDICKKDVSAWNRQINFLEALEAKRLPCGNGLTTFLDKEGFSSVSKKYINEEIIKALVEKGLLKKFYENNGTLEVVYKNPDIKKCLTKAGLALELKITATAQKLDLYGDVKNGVQIDWDGRTSSDGYDTENEIDVMMMCGVLPVFVSCKNGLVEMEELYKLSSVAHRFGGKYAKKVLVATALGKTGETAHYIRQRAQDMNIILLENIQNLTEKELEKALASLAQ